MKKLICCALLALIALPFTAAAQKYHATMIHSLNVLFPAVPGGAGP